ncbi:hypothetical protein Tco_0982295 [Tanacetum coccineum]
MRLKTDIKPKKATFQVALDALALTPFYQVFLITAEVPAIYMQEFWATVTVHMSSIRFTINKKKVSLDVETFREILHICPKIPRQQFEDVPLEHKILSFIGDLGYTRDISLPLLTLSVMSSASSTVTYTSVYTDSEPGRAFGEPMIRRYLRECIPTEDPQTPPVPQNEDEREPMFVQAHDPDYVPEPIYPEYILLEDEHEFSAEEQPLPPTWNDGDDDDGDSSGDNADEDGDDEDEDDDDEEEEEHLAPADSAIVVPVDEPVFPPEGTEPVIPPPSTDITIRARITVRVRLHILPTTRGRGERLARCTAPPAHSSPPPVPSPLLPSSGCPTQIQTLRIASTQALIDAVTAALPLPPSLYIPPPVDHKDEIPSLSRPPHATRGEQGIRDVRYGIRDTWVDPAEAVPEIAPMTVGEVNTRVTELAELHEHDTQDLYALLEDAQRRDSLRDSMDARMSPMLPERPWASLDRLSQVERITKKRTKNKAKTTKPDSEWKRP